MRAKEKGADSRFCFPGFSTSPSLSRGSSGHDPSHPCVIPEPCTGKGTKAPALRSSRTKLGNSWSRGSHKHCLGWSRVGFSHPADPGNKIVDQTQGSHQCWRWLSPSLGANKPCPAAQRLDLNPILITHFLFFFPTGRFWPVQRGL